MALALIEDANNVGQAASLEAQYREVGKPQNNFVLAYLKQLEAFSDRRVAEAFAAVLSEYVHSCEAGGVPDLDFMRKIAASPPEPGTGEIVDHDASSLSSRSTSGFRACFEAAAPNTQ